MERGGGHNFDHYFHKANEATHKAQRGVSYKHQGDNSRHKGGRFPYVRRSIPRMQGGGFASDLGGIMEVGTWLCSWLLVGL
jgi:hypothetical protein